MYCGAGRDSKEVTFLFGLARRFYPSYSQSRRASIKRRFDSYQLRRGCQNFVAECTDSSDKFLKVGKIEEGMKEHAGPRLS